MSKKLKLTRLTWKSLDRNNVYFQFIESCKAKQYDTNVSLQVHHIIPQYVLNKTVEGRAYMNLPENLVILSEEDHLKAHELLYEIYGNIQDQGACLMLKGQMNEARTAWKVAGAKATHEIQKENGTTVYNDEWQKEMAARSMARPDAREIRSKGGKKGGKTRNLDLVIKQDDCYLFKYKGNDVLCVFNCRTGGEVLEQLHLYKKTPLMRVSVLLKNSSKSLHGWSCVKISK